MSLFHGVPHETGVDSERTACSWIAAVVDDAGVDTFKLEYTNMPTCMADSHFKLKSPSDGNLVLAACGVAACANPHFTRVEYFVWNDMPQ